MMFAPFRAHLIAKVWGVPAVMIGVIAAPVVIAFSPMDSWLKLTFGLLDLPLLAAVGWRLVKGGEQATTDFALTRDGLFITNVPLGDFSKTLRQAFAAYRRHPLPQPSGSVHGVATQAASVVEEPAALPDTISVTNEAIEPPKDSGSLR